MLRLLFAATACLALAVSGGCGGGSGAATRTPAASALDERDQPDARIEISAEDNAFSRDEITVPAGAHVTIEFTSLDAAPHNFAVYSQSPSGEEDEVYVGETFSGPDVTVTDVFDAPAAPGEYFFRCDVHPAVMRGAFIVE
jgi:plastocyanin